WVKWDENSGGAAPGEISGTGESVLRYTSTFEGIFYLVVSSYGNNTSDPWRLPGRTAASQGNYVINTHYLPHWPDSPDLDAVSDTGASSTDNITNASSMKFSFTGQPGYVGQLYVDGVLRATDPNSTPGGLYEMTVSGLGDGPHSVTANLLDVSNGFASDLASTLTIQTDTMPPPAAAPDLAA